MNTPAATWKDLEVELARWREAGRAATLWWRDDDAVAPHDALARLVTISRRFEVPLSLAVIPARLSESLEPELARASRGFALQHGYAHRDHAAATEPAAELGAHRSASEVLSELERGRERLREVMQARFVPVLVPPWNRIDPGLVPMLHDIGFRGLSCFAPRRAAAGDGGIVIANCHVDPVNWRRGGVFRGQGRCLAALIEHLRARRLASVDPDEPTGLLTHHLCHDAEIWSFLERLFRRLQGLRAVRWLDARQVFAA